MPEALNSVSHKELLDAACTFYWHFVHFLEAVASSPQQKRNSIQKQLLGPDQVSVLNPDFRFAPAKVLRTDFSLVIATNLSW